MNNTENILVNSINTSIDQQNRHWDQLEFMGPGRYMREFQTVKISLPRVCGKTTAIINSFRPGIDTIVTHNTSWARELQRMIFEKQFQRRGIDLLTFFELKAIHQVNRSVLEKTIFPFNRLEGSRGRPSPLSFATDYYRNNIHDADLIIPITYFDEVHPSNVLDGAGPINSQVIMNIHDYAFDMQRKNLRFVMAFIGSW